MTLSSFYQLTEMRDYTFKDDITFIGFPNSKREGSAISVYSRIAISSKIKTHRWCLGVCKDIPV